MWNKIKLIIHHCIIFTICLSLVCHAPTPLKAHESLIQDIPLDTIITNLSSPQESSGQETVSYRQIDTWTLLPQELQVHPKAGRMHPEDITIAVKHEYPDKTETAHYIYRRPNTANNNHLSFEAPFYGEEETFIPKFELQYEGDPFWSLNKEIVTIAKYGHYIVFITKDHIYEDHLQLSFIDLSYFQSTLGEEEGYPAIFQMPVPLNSPLRSLTVEEGLLKVNDYEISREMLDEFGYLQAITWNIQANLIRSETFEEMSPFIDSFLESIESSQQTIRNTLITNTRPSMTKFNTPQQLNMFQQQLRGAIETARNSVKKINNEEHKAQTAWEASQRITADYLVEHQLAQTRMQNALQLQTEARKFLGRARILFERLKMPRPAEGGSIRQALAFVLGSLRGPNGQKAWQFKEGVLQLIHNPKLKFGVPFTLALSLGATYPARAYDYMYQVISLGGIILDKIGENFLTLYNLFNTAVSANGFFKPQQVWQAYAVEGDFSAFVIANIILILGPLSFLAISHLTVNAYHALSDLKQEATFQANHHTGSIKTNIQNTLGSLRQGFIHQQNQNRRNYLIDQAISSIDARERDFTEEETEQVIHILKERHDAEQTFIGRFFERVSAPLKRLKFFQNKEVNNIEIQNLRSAIMYLIFSWRSFENTNIAYAHLYHKYIFLKATYFWKPPTFLGLIYYPNALNVITHYGIESKAPHPITTANGGNRPFWREYPLLLANLIGRGPYKAYKEWESHIIPIENLIKEEIQKRALKLTLQKIKTRSLSHRAYTASDTQDAISNLNGQNERLYMALTDRLFAKTFQRVISPVFESTHCYHSIEVCLDQIDQYKESTLDVIKSVNPSRQDINNAIDQIESDVLTEVENKESSPHRGVNRVRSLVHNALYKNLNHNKNMAIEMWLVVKEQMQDTRARSRNARKSLYQLFEKIPRLYITWAAVSGFMLSALAGDIPRTDVLVPLTNQFPYYSQFLFGAGFLFHSIKDMLSSFGTNLQVEYNLKKQGVFNRIPKGKDVHLNFIQWFSKQFKNKDNTILKHITTMTRITWANVPATLLLTSLLYPLIMGRFPLDLYLISYLGYFMFPIWAFNIKIEQTMEAAMSGYWMKFFSKDKLENHPLAQNYDLKKKVLFKTIMLIFWTFLYLNILSATLNNLQYMGDESSREFARVFFFGHPPTVWAVKGFNVIKEFFDQTPLLINTIIDTCQTALTNGYDGWDPTLDGPPPENVKVWVPEKAN